MSGCDGGGAFIGSGDIYVAELDANGNSLGERYVGNATELIVKAPDVEKKDQIGYGRKCYGQTIKSVTTKIEQEFSMTLTDILGDAADNLSMAMYGQKTTYSQTAGNNTGTPYTVRGYIGKYTPIGKRNLSVATPPVVENEAGTTTYVRGTDYEVDYELGRIRPLQGGAITDGQILSVEATWLGITSGFRILANQVMRREVLIRMDGEDQANGKRVELLIHKAEVNPSADISWIGEDYMTLEISGKLLTNALGESWEVLDLGTFATT